MKKNCTNLALCIFPTAGVPVQYCEQPTNGISYFRAISSITDIPEELREYLPLFCYILTKYDVISFAAVLCNIYVHYFIGELYDIGWKQKLFMGCSGRGPPTVIFDAPTGQSSDAWALIAPEIAKIARVCIYDRAGLGFSDRPLVNWSDPQQAKRGKLSTSERMVEDFHRLFALSSDQPKPFILVGAELGAVNARFFTNMFENDVESLVLINPLAEEGLFGEEWTKLWYERYASSQQVLQFSAAVGITRIALIFGLMKPPMQHKLLSSNVTMRQKHLLCKPGHLSAAVDEFFFANESLAQLRMLRKLKPFPQSATVSVISSALYDEKLSRELNQVNL